MQRPQSIKIAILVILVFCFLPLAYAKKLPAGTIQKGTLANGQLISDAMMGVAGKAGTLGCTKMDSYKQYVVSLPEGSPGSRVWHEKWIVTCAGTDYPIDIRFNESGMGAADYLIE